MSLMWHSYESPDGAWPWYLLGLIVLVVGAVMWAALSAWSSTGALMAGVCMALIGVLMLVPDIVAARFDWPWPLFILYSPEACFMAGPLILSIGITTAAVRSSRR